MDIIERLLPNLKPSLRAISKSLKRRWRCFTSDFWYKWWGGAIAIAGVALVILGICFGIITLLNDSNNRAIAKAATERSYKVGQQVICDTRIDSIAGDNTWASCTVLAKTPDNRFYDVKFISPSAHYVVYQRYAITNMGDQ